MKRREISISAPSWAIGALGLLFLVLGVGAYHYFFGRYQLPYLTRYEVDSSYQAGKIDRLVGNVSLSFLMPHPGVLDENEVPETPRTLPTLAQEGASFPLGTAFRVPGGASVHVITEGNWVVGMEGDGEFSFEDAKRDENHRLHSVAWTVSRGTLRARPQDYDPSDLRIQIGTPTARIVVRKGEVGVRIDRGGHGQVWLFSGSATIVWNDGKRGEINHQGMRYL